MSHTLRELAPIERLFKNNNYYCDIEQNGLEFVVECRDKKTNRPVQRCTFRIDEMEMSRNQAFQLGIPSTSTSVDNMSKVKLRLVNCEML